MKRCVNAAGLALILSCTAQSWAQSSSATGTYLGQKVPPMLATELDAASSRATPLPSGHATGPIGIRRGLEREQPASVPTYTGIQNSQSMGSAVPSPATDSSSRR